MSAATPFYFLSEGVKSYADVKHFDCFYRGLQKRSAALREDNEGAGRGGDGKARTIPPRAGRRKRM